MRVQGVDIRKKKYLHHSKHNTNIYIYWFSDGVAAPSSILYMSVNPPKLISIIVTNINVLVLLF